MLVQGLINANKQILFKWYIVSIPCQVETVVWAFHLDKLDTRCYACTYKREKRTKNFVLISRTLPQLLVMILGKLLSDTLAGWWLALCSALSKWDGNSILGEKGHSKRGAENDQHLPVALDKVYTDQEKKTPEPIKVLGNLFLATSYTINLYRSTLSTGLIVLCLVTSGTSLQLRLQESKCTNPCRDKNPLSSLKQWFLVFRLKSPGLNWRSFSTGSTIPAPPLALSSCSGFQREETKSFESYWRTNWWG